MPLVVASPPNLTRLLRNTASYVYICRLEAPNARDQIALCGFYSFLVEVQTNAGYMHFNLHDSSLGRLVNAASRKSLEIQAYSITKPRTLLKLKFV